MSGTERGEVIHGVECYEAWREERDCRHEGVPHQECIKAALRNGTVDPRERTLELRADLAALRTEREEAVRLLCRAYEWTRHAPCVADGTCVHCAVDAFLARTDTGGQETR